MESRPPSPTLAAKCLGVLMTPSPSIPRQKAAPRAEARNGSSPYVSSVRPQRTSRAILTTGDRTCRIPRVRVSRPVARATRRPAAQAHGQPAQAVRAEPARGFRVGQGALNLGDFLLERHPAE